MSTKRRLELLQDARIARRDALLGAAALLLAGCSKNKDAFSCMDVSGLSPEDAGARVQAQYVDRTTEAGKNCESCQQFVEGKDGCGSCKLLKGPVHPWGYCKVYAQKS